MSSESPLNFERLHQAEDCHARVGRVTTPHGSFDTPAFMPVGTQATVKGLLPSLVAGTGAQVVLSNTYHLMLRPGSELIAEMGGLHGWMGWDRPILTDSGGFQVFSLADANRIDEDGVTFKSHLDGREIVLTPERSMQVQRELGADIIMAFDDCPPAVEGGSDEGEGARQPVKRGQGPVARHAVAPGAYKQRVREACERSIRWLQRCVAAHGEAGEQAGSAGEKARGQALFGIVQGGTDLDERTWSAEATCQFDLPGFAIGGVAVGEGYEGLKAAVEHTAPLLPADRPRYLMGVGYERDILTAVRAGVDMFDCVLPTRNARNANAFTPTGQMRLKNAKFTDDPRPIDETCDCVACGGQGLGPGAEGRGGGPGVYQPASRGGGGGFSRSYLRHLFLAGEMLGPILVTLHNIRHFQRYLLDIRRAIADNDWSLVHRRWPVALERA